MGVPKFFRWLSERYPAISQLIAENRIPEFDCLYLDMNGIIHNCTHKDSDDVHFRVSEEEMFITIFNYIEHLFGKIKPKKLFLLAIDGVAPRAKMNQQRARRFRAALDAEKAREKAVANGKKLPEDAPFDSNCITPGTEFMAKLTLQLKYFINKKVSEDKEWQAPEIVLSGHEVPGEGEHKIMEYIRNARAQVDYNPNVRHCLYGLDADLIMLGLLSHDPHFCLLREEVTFGRQPKTKCKELEHQNFYLLHLCIVREYLELEFQGLKEPGAMRFSFDMERVIDDFILMAFFVGNDFLPTLPHLHINEGALAVMFGIYKRILPRCDGYLNEGGTLHIQRMGLLLEELSKNELSFFEREIEDANWLRGKRMAEQCEAEKNRMKAKGTFVTSSQKSLWRQQIRKFLSNNSRNSPTLDLGTNLKAEDRQFVKDLADAVHISWCTKEDAEGQHHLLLEVPDGGEGDEAEEAQSAMLRLIKRYDNAPVVDLTAEDAQAAMDAKYKEKFQGWKDTYYYTKFKGWTEENKDEELQKLAENYIQGVQWVLYYYYRGIASWPWFYRYHYAPLISDVMKGLKANLKFDLGQPFKPNEQLMGVLPERSKTIVPKVYWGLMTDPKSPIIDFYPRDFELDMNGKKMEWEAVVKIPFIDEKRLLDAMGPKNELLSDEEKARNDFGVALKFTHSDDVDFVYPSPLMGIFPAIEHCHCVENIYELPTVEGLDYRVGLTDGALLNVSALAGFPTLATLPYTASLGFYQVNVFQSESRNESMVVALSDTARRTKVETAKAKLGKRCFVGYPFLQEAKIVRVSDELSDYFLAEDGSGQVIAKEHAVRQMEEWTRKSEKMESFYSKRLGILIGMVESTVHVQILKGLVKTEEGASVKEYGDIPGMETDYAAQIIVDEVVNEDKRFVERAALPVEEESPIGSRGFFLGDFNYGQPAEVLGHAYGKLSINILVLDMKEPNFGHQIMHDAQKDSKYMAAFQVARDLSLHPLVLSKITSSFYVRTLGELRVNLGLNLKFEARKQKVLGYSRKSETGWCFSPAACHVITEYMTKFPDFFAGICRNHQFHELRDTEIWPNSTVGVARVKEIVSWLKTLPSNSMDRVPLDADQLDSDVVMRLAQAADGLKLHEVAGKPRQMNGVPRNAMLRPDDAEHRLGNQRFSLGDRVEYAANIGKVQLAARGTVVGISRTATTKLIDVVFDVTFMSGNTLSGRCPPFRGQTVPSTTILNLSDRQLVAGSKATMARQLVMPSVTTLTAHGGFRMINVRQYRDATPPAQLSGSFRGAMNGGRGGRGNGLDAMKQHNLAHRGGPPERQGYCARGNVRAYGANWRGGLADGDALLATPAVPVGGYHAVPPPSALEASRGGRGRGRGGVHGSNSPRHFGSPRARGGRGEGGAAAWRGS